MPKKRPTESQPATPPEPPPAPPQEVEEAEEMPPVYATRVVMLFQADDDGKLAEVVSTVVTYGSGAMALAAVLLGGDENTTDDPVTDTLATCLVEPENGPVLCRRNGQVVLKLFSPQGASTEVVENHGDYLVGVRIEEVREASPEEIEMLTAHEDDADTDE